MPHVERDRTCLVLLLVVSVTACGGRTGSSSSPRVTRTDSAGIAIVTSEAEASDVPIFATLDSAPDLRLGTLDGPKEEQFGSVLDLALLSDGGVAVLDGQAAEIRVFGPDGTFRRTVGQKGEGPGELSSPRSLDRLAGDTLAVYDSGTARITLFAPDGTLVRVRSVAFDGYGRPFLASFWPDGAMVGESRYVGSGSLPGDADLSYRRDSAVLVVSAPDGSLRDTVDVLPNRELLLSVAASAQGFNIRMISARFARSNVFAAGPDGVWSGFGDHFALRLLDPEDGHVERIVRAPGLDRPLTDREANEVLRQGLADAETPEERRTAQKVNDLSPRPELRPAYDRLVLDDEARLWLRAWPGADTDTHRWWIFARDGALLGSVDVPAGFHLMAVERGRAWGVVRDELDVPYVVRYAVRSVER